jgi:ribosomal-protein-alanine N-acetyltransferase
VHAATIARVSTRLETARLVLRTCEPRDAEDWHALVSDPEVRRFLPASPPPAPELFDQVLERRLQLEREHGFAMWAVELEATGAYIGQSGCFPVGGVGPEIELAYHFLPSSWGKGYATEAAVAALSHALGTAGLDRVIAIVFPENIASCRVVEKAGMRYEGTATYFDLPDLRTYAAEGGWWHPPVLAM